MAASADTLRTHLEYTAWATRRLLEAAARLSPAELSRDFNTSDKSVVGTLAHTFAADRIWLARLQNEAGQGFISDDDRQLTVLQREWPALHGRWKQWAEALTDASVAAVVSYKDIRGNPWTTPIWQILLHVVNHGTHHRGQVSGFLRAMGQTPPPLDLIAFYREK
ncbi:MAG: DinB family protein [Bryobacteraceae bacterium]